MSTDPDGRAEWRRQAGLGVAALGVVYGDIGTSPLYAFREIFANGLVASEADVLAALSAIFWSLLVTVSLKYVGLMLRFDDNGQGGLLALTAIARHLARGRRWQAAVVGIGLVGASLFYGDAIITPAISVLSAVEGIGVIAPRFQMAVLPLTVAILLGLFMMQHRGTGWIGSRLFGPVMAVWFTVLAGLGIAAIAQTPSVLQAINPMHALRFTLQFPAATLVLLGAVFLVVTGCEALYTDLGHFGRRPIRWAWYSLVWPALLLNYFGQGAMALRVPSATLHPFYYLAPSPLRIPLLILATAATVIAAQAVIAGVFSMTAQAIRLGYLPQLGIRHTSEREQGQIYMPGVNWLMFIAVIALVTGFPSSRRLANAYGIAVAGAMLTTTALVTLATVVLPLARKWWWALPLGFFALFEAIFLSANLLKVKSGGWVPLAIGTIMALVLSTWRLGQQIIAAQRRAGARDISRFLAELDPETPRSRGTAVYLASDPMLVPHALGQNLRVFGSVHEHMVLLHVGIEPTAHVPREERARLATLAPGVHQCLLRFGYRDAPNVWQALHDRQVLPVPPEGVTFFISRAMPVVTGGVMARWRARLFIWIARLSETEAGYYGLPPARVVEVGTEVVF